MAAAGQAMDVAAVLDRLCHRYPAWLVDAVIEFEPGRRISAVKNVTINEEFFQGHFPAVPLMPGVLLIESLTQAATLLLLHDGEQVRNARTLRIPCLGPLTIIYWRMLAVDSGPNLEAAATSLIPL